jgi:hypothetical protein
MAVHMKDIWKLLDDADHHARALLRTNTEIRSLLTGISIPERPAHPCPHCGLDLHGPTRLALHVANVHDGPSVPLTADEQVA